MNEGTKEWIVTKKMKKKDGTKEKEDSNQKKTTRERSTTSIDSRWMELTGDSL